MIVREEDVLLANVRAFLYPNPLKGGIADRVAQLVDAFERQRERLQAAEGACEAAESLLSDARDDVAHFVVSQILDDKLQNWRRLRKRGAA